MLWSIAVSADTLVSLAVCVSRFGLTVLETTVGVKGPSSTVVKLGRGATMDAVAVSQSIICQSVLSVSFWHSPKSLYCLPNLVYWDLPVGISAKNGTICLAYRGWLAQCWRHPRCWSFQYLGLRIVPAFNALLFNVSSFFLDFSARASSFDSHTLFMISYRKY